MDGELYGDPAEAADFDHTQTANEDCVEMSAADVIGQLTGDEPSEAEITAAAGSMPGEYNTNPLTGGPEPLYNPSSGTDLRDAPELLADYGVQATYTDDQTGASSIDTLEADLASGDKIIASVDGEEVWSGAGDPTGPDPGTADHAVVVTGVDTQNNEVYLNDSGVPNGAEEAVPLSVFEAAWVRSGDGMVVAEPNVAASSAIGAETSTSSSTIVPDSGSSTSTPEPNPVIEPIILPVFDPQSGFDFANESAFGVGDGGSGAAGVVVAAALAGSAGAAAGYFAGRHPRTSAEEPAPSAEAATPAQTTDTADTAAWPIAPTPDDRPVE